MRSIAAIGTMLALVALGGIPPAAADSDEESPEVVHQSRLQIRATPVGTSLFSDTGYRIPILENQEGILFDDTRVDTGVTTGVSPTYLWGGPYVELLPLSVLELRFAIQGMGYWGTFGHLYVPSEDPIEEPTRWSDTALDRAWEEGLGQPSIGWQARARATPQILYNRWAATAETTYRRISMGVDGPYYEPYFDLLLAPAEHLWEFRPTVGYVFGEELDESHLLVGLRWERVVATRAGVGRDVIGLVWDWGVSPDILDWGDPRISGFGGAQLDHPTRSTVYPYLGAEAVVEF